MYYVNDVKRFMKDHKKALVIGTGVVVGGVICKGAFTAGNYYGSLSTLMYIAHKSDLDLKTLLDNLAEVADKNK